MQPSIPFPKLPLPSLGIFWLSRHNMVWNILLVNLVSSPCCVPFQDLAKPLPTDALLDRQSWWCARAAQQQPKHSCIAYILSVANAKLEKAAMGKWTPAQPDTLFLCYFLLVVTERQFKKHVLGIKLFSENTDPTCEYLCLHSLLHYHDQLPVWRLRFDNGHNSFSFRWIFYFIILIPRFSQNFFCVCTNLKTKQCLDLMGRKRRKSSFFEIYFSLI